MAFDCPQHAGKRNERSRLKLDDVMNGLRENQSGAGRHKCPYCAYEKGFIDGLRQAGDVLRSLIMREADASVEKGR